LLAPLKARKNMFSLLIVFVLLLGLISLTARGRQEVSMIEDVVLVILTPVQGVFQRITRSAESVLATVRNYQYLLKENERLTEQLVAAATLESRLAELRRENHRLRQLLNLEARSEHELMAAEVTAREASGWFQTMTINRGATHGVAPRMAVVTSEGLVGNVLSVTTVSAQVLLLTDTRQAVSALVQRSRDPGEATGIVESAAGRLGSLKMINLPREANIQTGDTVISSGLGGVFPKGLVIGYVLETGEDEYAIMKYALLKPAANFNRLEEVFVVLTSPAGR